MIRASSQAAVLPTTSSHVRISVVTPSFNQGEFLEATIKSVLDQTGVELEYIVMDADSTDESGEILARFADRITYLNRRKDAGQTDALIKGFEHATGDILGWLNSDDLYEPGALARVLAHFTHHPADRFIFGDSTWINRGGTVLRRKREVPFNRWVWLRTYNYIPQPSAFWRRELYEEVGGLDRAFELAMDTDLFARFAERTRPVHVAESWSRMRSHPDQKNVRLRAQSDQEDAVIRRRYASTNGIAWGLQRGVARLIRVASRLAIGAYTR
jgi:glycosyltransferase involved in cell wall biosynthesis